MRSHYGGRAGEPMRYPEDYACPEKFLPISKEDFCPTRGTLLYNGNAYVYSVQEDWNSPFHGYEAHKHMWLWIGSPGWWYHTDNKALYDAIVTHVGKENMPSYHREHIVLSDFGNV